MRKGRGIVGASDEDLRIDPRLKALGGPPRPLGDVVSREELLAEVSRPDAVNEAEQLRSMME